jgi:hypothetical protein
MSAPYKVWIHGPYVSHDRMIDCETLPEAIEKALAYEGKGWVSVIGDGAEGGYGDDGSQWRDGLTDEEREMVEEAGV